MDRNEIKQKEIKRLSEEYKKSPLLFGKETFIDTPEFLEDFGIFINGKDKFPSGYLKLWPQDFIVEEITEDGTIQNIGIGNTFKNAEGISEKDKTIYATMVKCDLSTLEAVDEIASILEIDNKQVGFSGIKDKDAITSQLISLRRVKANDIENFQSPYIFLKNAYFGKGVAEIGKLKGNEFTVLVRTDKNFREQEFSAGIDTIKKDGFFNFFYLQRFGTPRLINFYWGFSILKGEYEKAVLNFLISPGKRELPYFCQLRKEFGKNFGNWEKIEELIEFFPLIFQNEKKVVSYLKKNPKDFLGALNQIPEQVQLWLFALASLLFNKKLSSYIKKGESVPETIPLILSDDKNDWDGYQDILYKNGVELSHIESLKRFPFIQLKKRLIKTKERIKILDYKIIKEGVILDFILPKACYATTFLAHLFNLVSGLPLDGISEYPIDTKASLGKESLEETLNKFQKVIHPKTEDLIKELSI